MQSNNIIGKNIRNLRKRFGMNQVNLSDKLDVSKQSVSNWETGYKVPRMGMIKHISELFNVNITDITERKKERLLNIKPAPKIKSYKKSGTKINFNGPISINAITEVCLGLTPDHITDVYHYALNKLKKQSND